MKIFVKAKPNAKEEWVEKIDSAHFVISVKEPPIQGRANEAIKKVLADQSVKIVSGHYLRRKIIDIIF